MAEREFSAQIHQQYYGLCGVGAVLGAGCSCGRRVETERERERERAKESGGQFLVGEKRAKEEDKTHRLANSRPRHRNL
jgi:hypothetical protein